MPSPRGVRTFSIALTLACACMLAPIIVDAAPSDHVVPGRIVRLGDASRQIALARVPAWQEFQRRNGDWRALWNEQTGTPHRAFGRGIPLPGFSSDAESVDRAVRGFMGRNPDLFGGRPDLATVHATHAGRLWYVRYLQRVDGHPVLFSDWEFRVSSDGRLTSFGADAYHASDYARPATDIGAAAAREAAKAGLAFDPATDRVEGGEHQYLLPVARGTSNVLRLVYQTRVFTSEPRGQWLTFVDAENGEVLYRANRVRQAISGTVTSLVHQNDPFEERVTLPLKGAWVNVGAAKDTTDGTGFYSAPAAGTVTVSSQLMGPWCLVLRQDSGTNANFSKSVNNPAVENIAWTSGNALDAERDAFYHCNVAHDWLKVLDPAYTANDLMIPVNVQWTDDECSSWYEDAIGSLNFTEAGATCPATATIPDMIYHEYTHSVNDKLYLAEGASFGMQSPVLHEGIADVFAAYMTDSPIVGDGFFGIGTYLRNIDNTNRWPEDANPSSHVTGEILGGAMWDLREAVGLATASSLAHFARYGLPDDIANPGVAMAEYFVEILLVDDDDANLANGTPNFTAIVDAFNAHGIGTGVFLNITHDALLDQPTNGPYPISAVIQYTGPIGALTGATLYYSVNNLPFDSAVMNPTGNPDEWGAEVPPQSAGIVRYYIEAEDSYGGTQIIPVGAPAKDMNAFVAGPAFPLIVSDMEVDPGWTIGAGGDNAISGIWLRADPVGTQAQPEDDHTVSGTQCYVTGNAPPEEFPGYNDVDGGKTTLLSAPFDATGWGLPMVSYWRWYSNDTGDAGGEDFWRVDISNDGGSNWVPVEATTESGTSWRRILFFIEDYLPVTSTMRMRFIADDSGNPSLVEAALDDWDLLAFPPGVGVGPQAPGRALSLGAPSPNPARGTTAMRIQVPDAGRVHLAVYDIHGRLIRTLVDRALDAGPHTFAWDGRDARGRAVANGPYFVRLGQQGRTVSRAVVMIK